MSWVINSHTFYLILEITLDTGLIGYYDYDLGFVTDINKATWFQNKEQVQETSPVLPVNTYKHEYIMVEVEDHTNKIVETIRKDNDHEKS